MISVRSSACLSKTEGAWVTELPFLLSFNVNSFALRRVSRHEHERMEVEVLGCSTTQRGTQGATSLPRRGRAAKNRRFIDIGKLISPLICFLTTKHVFPSRTTTCRWERSSRLLGPCAPERRHMGTTIARECLSSLSPASHRLRPVLTPSRPMQAAAFERSTGSARQPYG
jgi:hypothetical protein